MDYKDMVGSRLKYLRKKHKVKVESIMKLLDISRSTYTNYELGYRAPSGDKLVLLADLYDTTVDFLTGKTNEEEVNIELTDAILEGAKNGKFVHN
ncbi:XRE family transcriptional regulator, partial [Salmonella enterica subsp. enterica]|nr:XRE family transcriptional regulator [Salmonella enterica subsp. enterica serovar Paratyphi A]